MANRIAFSVTVAGDLSDYGSTEAQTFSAQFAASAGVHASDVTTSFAAGSVIANVEMIAPEDATAVLTSLNALLNNTAQLSSALGVGIESVSEPPLSITPIVAKPSSGAPPMVPSEATRRRLPYCVPPFFQIVEPSESS